MKDRFIMIICLLLPLLILTSCIKPKTTSLSGTVLLENDTGDANLDPVDHAGVTIALYQPAQLDTTLTRINNEYPTTGVLISQETEFDHRLATPLKTALSGADTNNYIWISLAGLKEMVQTQQMLNIELRSLLAYF